ncbi:MAG: hypothetical protein PHI85_04650 [Victivallaceae bacterium]|nr:hypothetical protein [Victivallaceae bacterium]
MIKTKHIRYAVLLLASLAAAGCSVVRVDYQGEEFSPAAMAAVTPAAPVGMNLIGRAVASAPAAQTDRAAMEAALLDKARSVGAEAVVVTNYQVTPNPRINGIMRESSTSVWGGENAETANWIPMQNDFNGGYGSADLSDFFTGGTSKAAPPVEKVYTRVLYADFYSTGK